SCLWAWASRRFDFSRPPVKIGWLIWGTKFHARVLASKRFESWLLSVPKKPVRLISGKNSAFATPILALNAIRFSSAERISGRRASKDEGSPGGTGGGCGWGLKEGPPGKGAGGLPNSKLNCFLVFLIFHPAARIVNGRPVYELFSLTHVQHCRNTALLHRLDQLK